VICEHLIVHSFVFTNEYLIEVNVGLFVKEVMLVFIIYILWLPLFLNQSNLYGASLTHCFAHLSPVFLDSLIWKFLKI
jgi:hypothetical protein